MPLRVFFARPRLFISIVVGIAVGALLPYYFSELRGVARLLVGWDIGVALYLMLAFWMIAIAARARLSANLSNKTREVLRFSSVRSSPRWQALPPS
jgi:uncharacterized membrane protein